MQKVAFLLCIVASYLCLCLLRRHVGSHEAIEALSGPLNRLNAILSLLHPLDRYRTPFAIGSAIGKPLSRIQTQVTGGSPQPRRSKPLGGLNRAIVVL